MNKYFDSLYTPDQSGNNFVNVIVRTAAGGQVMQVNYTNTNIEAAGDVAQYVNGVPVIVSGVQSDGAGGSSNHRRPGHHRLHDPAELAVIGLHHRR